MTRNPHAAEPFTDDDQEIAVALQDVSVPALLCSLVHMTGDPAWIRGRLLVTVAVCACTFARQDDPKPPRS